MDNQMSDPRDPTSDENVQQSILVVLLQIKDILAGILAGTSEEDYQMVTEHHRRGFLVLPPPWVIEKKEDDGEVPTS